MLDHQWLRRISILAALSDDDHDYVAIAVAARNALPALIAVAEAARAYVSERENPVPCHVMRRKAFEDLTAALAKLEEGNG